MPNRLLAALSGTALTLALGLAISAPAPVAAEGLGERFSARTTLGYGRLFNNDFLGDHEDRWQTGSYNISVVRGQAWEGTLPSAPFEIMEYRFGGSIIAPSVLRNPPPGDRRYVGRLHFAAKTHFAPLPGTEADLGLGLVATGPGTGISDLHTSLHRLFSAPRPVVAKDQLGDHIYPVLDGEIGRPVDLGWAELRPFMEGRAGDETFVRAGVDFRFGQREQGALWLRDEITGQRYVGISGTGGEGTSFVLGADIAHVFDSQYFPAADGVDFEPTRKRLRAGISTKLGLVGLFYGVTWMSEEFVGQPEGQVVGSLRARVNF